MKAVRKYYEQLGEEFERALNEMLAFDAIVCNTDRHLGNFGVLVDSHTNKIIAPAPLFDHGNALFSLAGDKTGRMKHCWKRTFPHCFPVCMKIIWKRQDPIWTGRISKKKIRRLLNFKFENPGTYNYPAKRIKDNRVTSKKKSLFIAVVKLRLTEIIHWILLHRKAQSAPVQRQKNP